MNDKAAARELLAAANEMMGAGSLFSGYARTAIGAHAEMLQAIERIENHIHYRLYGTGYRDEITGDPVLTPTETVKAKIIMQHIQRIKKVIDQVYPDIRELRGHAESLDTFMHFS